MIRRLPALLQVQAGDISKKLLNQILQIVYPLYQAKKVSKKVCNNIVNSIKVQHKIDTIFMNSENRLNI